MNGPDAPQAAAPASSEPTSEGRGDAEARIAAAEATIAELRRENAMLTAIADVLPGGYLDADLRCRFVSGASTPYRAGVMSTLGRHARDVMGPDDFAVAEPYLRAALAGEPQCFERPLSRPDGVTSWLRLHYVPHRVDGVVKGVAIALVDVTDAHRARRAAEIANETLETRIQERTAALIASEERFGRAFHSAPVAFAIRSALDDRIVDVNDRFLAMIGTTRPAVIGRPFAESGLEAPARSADRAQAAGSVEVAFVTGGGDRRVALASSEPITFGVQGACLLSSFVDITERKHAESRLAAQHAVSRVLASASSIEAAAGPVLRAICQAERQAFGTIWVVDPDRDHLTSAGCWYDANDRALIELAALTAQTSFSNGEGRPGVVWAAGQTSIVRQLGEDAGFARAGAARTAGLRTGIFVPIVHNRETLGVLELLGRSLPDDARLNDLLAVVSSHVGVFLAHRRDALVTRRSADRLAAVIRNLREGIVLVNRAGKILHWNPAALTLHDIQLSNPGAASIAAALGVFELATLDGSRVLPQDEWPVARVLRGEVLSDYELRVRRRDIDWQRILSYGGALVEQEDGTSIAVMTISDVTERVRREEQRRFHDQLVEDNRRVREASRLKSEFLANLSHELRTPLNAIIGFATLLHAGKAGALSDVQREYLGDVLTSSRHLLQLINDLLDLAKIEAGRMELVITPTDMQRVVGEVRDVLRPLAEQKRLGLEVEVGPGVETILIDQRMVKQILYNFVSNAIKFTPDQGLLSIRVLREDEGHVRIEVSDTGIGIRPEDLGRLFVSFEQLEAGSNKRFQGTGLGLALTKKLAEAHGGRVGVTSTFGAGSRFFVILPLTPAGPPSPSA